MQVDLKGPAGRLEAMYEEPRSPRFAAVVCHPHPLFGGTMHNHATYRLARAARSVGGATLRFNFRGVGLSQGRWDEGRGEVEDARAALAWLADRRPDLPRYACGFSLGAYVALRTGCADAAVRGVLAAGVPLRTFPLDFVPACPKPVAAVQAAQDEFGPVDEVRRLLAEGAAPRRVAVIPGATHLFTEDLAGLQREAESGLSWLLENA